MREAIYKVLFQQQQLVKRTLCLQLSPTKCSKRTSGKFVNVTFQYLSLRLYLTGWYSTELPMQKYSAYEE